MLIPGESCWPYRCLPVHSRLTSGGFEPSGAGVPHWGPQEMTHKTVLSVFAAIALSVFAHTAIAQQGQWAFGITGGR